jgi:hypothetical protein
MITHYRTTRILWILGLLLLSIPSARAGVVQVDFVPDLLLTTPNQAINIDLDSNGTVDFIFFYDLYQNGAFLHVNVPLDLQGTNGVVVNGFRNEFGKDQILPLDSGATISAASLFNGPISGNGPLFAQPSFGGGDIMEGRGDNYIGFRFTRNGATHYGWFFVNVDSAGVYAAIKGYAYEATPEVPITIGSAGIVRVEMIRVSGYAGVSGIATPGGTLLMEATVFPDNATNKNVVWDVNDTTIATITSDGILVARKNGEVLVTATSVDNPGVAGSASITISGQPTTSVRPSAIASGVRIDFLPESRMLRIDRNGDPASGTIIVSDISGRTVATERIDASASTSLLDLSALRSGDYFVLYNGDDGIARRRFGVAR